MYHGTSYRDHCFSQAQRLVKPLPPAELIPLVTRPHYHGLEIYALCKQIDGMPGVDGMAPLAGCRASNFLGQRQRQFFYEHMGDSERIRDQLIFNQSLRRAYAPEWSLPQITVMIDIFNSAYTPPDGVLKLPHPGEKNAGGHAVSLTGGWRESGQILEFMNWWGGGWGNRGLGYVSLEYLNRYLIEAWLFRDVSVGASALTYHWFMQATNERERARAWLLRQPRWQVQRRHGGFGHQLVVYETLSLVDECPVQIIEVRTGFGIRVGWAHLFHLGGKERTSVLKELFVWPSFRRRGYGSILESIAVENARGWGAERLHILFYEMDAQIPARAAGRLFGQYRGYQWRRRRGVRPQVTAVGEKSL
jgi:GNAT superfamily N-acetyltransferase